MNIVSMVYEIYLSIYLSVYLSIYISIYLYIHIYIHINIVSIYSISGRGFKSDSGQLSTATSKNPSVVNTICINSFRY